MDDARSERARARAAWPIRRLRLDQVGEDDDLSTTTSVEERLAMMWPLALDAWAMGSKPLPNYERSEMPGRVLRRSDG
jgi:hypothetical protein